MGFYWGIHGGFARGCLFGTSADLSIYASPGYSPHFKVQGEQYGPFALSLLPIGAYEPRWFMKDIHLNPEEAVQAHLDLNSQQSLGIQFGVFQLTWEAIDSPITDLEAALDALGLPRETFWVLEPGGMSVGRRLGR